MTVDPWEGVGPDNLITTGAHVDRIPDDYQHLVAKIVSKLVAAHEDVLAIYLYGSVATGMATPPTSDLDLLGVLDSSEGQPAIRRVATELSERHHTLVSEVSIATVTVPDVWADTVDGLGWRCFLKHYCVHLHGAKIHESIESCRATPEIAWAFNHDVAEAVSSARANLTDANSPSDVAVICRTAAKKVSLAATSLVSVAENRWTTDRATAAASIARLYPEWADMAQTALRWRVIPSGKPEEVTRFLEGYASWVADELKRLCHPPR